MRNFAYVIFMFIISSFMFAKVITTDTWSICSGLLIIAMAISDLIKKNNGN